MADLDARQRIEAVHSMPAAGKSTRSLNNSSYAYFDPHQKNTVIIEQYTKPFRKPSTEAQHGTAHSTPEMWQVMQYDHSATWRPEQGLASTRFGKGFTRRQASVINPYADRIRHEEASQQRSEAMREFRRAYLTEKVTFRQNGYNVITGEELAPEKAARRPERRHVRDFDRSSGPGSDKPAFRLKDSTARFHATAEQMPRRPARTANLVREGIQPSQRTSTIIGVGKTIRHEIPSKGIADAFPPE